MSMSSNSNSPTSRIASRAVWSTKAAALRLALTAALSYGLATARLFGSPPLRLGSFVSRLTATHICAPQHGLGNHALVEQPPQAGVDAPCAAGRACDAERAPFR